MLAFGGALSGEHGDGLVRGAFTEKMFGAALYDAFRTVKRTFDPAGLFNPGKIVDTPPIGLLSDANLLSSMIDTTLLVVSAKSTPYPMVQRAAQAIGTNRILGVVLNRADQAGNPAYGYYGTKHYQAGHPLPARRRWFGWLRRSGGVPHVQ